MARKPSKVDELLARVNSRNSKTKVKRNLRTRISDWFLDNKKALYIGIGATIVAAGVGSWLTFNYATKRQDYPQRDVLFSVKQERFYVGGETSSSSENIDKLYTSMIFNGSVSGGTSRTEQHVATVKHEMVDNFKSYFLLDNNNNIIASGSTNREILQPSISFSGDYFYLQSNIQFSESNPIQGGLTIADFEREAWVVDRTKLDIMEIDGKQILYNKLTEQRAIPQGLFTRSGGRTMRRATNLEKYDVPSDDPQVQKLLGLIQQYNSKAEDNGALSAKERAKIYDEILEVEEGIPKITIYNSMEDGIIDWMPQESTTYLNHKSTFGERTSFEFKNMWEHIKSPFSKEPKKSPNQNVFRVENDWDLFPGNIALLNKWRYESEDGTEVFSLFDKYNNGGYKIVDEIGTLAEIKIVDFFFKYDRDLIFEYYLDKDGNGKIDEKKELIGKVLYKQRGSQSANDPDAAVGVGQDKRDISVNYLYVFMGGADSNTRMEDFRHCGNIEAAMPNEINRGYGKHSNLGWIKDARANIILNAERHPKNLSRVMLEESPITAPQDIYNLLAAGKRPYAEAYAKAAQLGDSTLYSTPKTESLDSLLHKVVEKKVPLAKVTPIDSTTIRLDTIYTDSVQQ